MGEKGDRSPQNFKWEDADAIDPTPRLCHVSKFQALDCLHCHAIRILPTHNTDSIFISHFFRIVYLQRPLDHHNRWKWKALHFSGEGTEKIPLGIHQNMQFQVKNFIFSRERA